MKSSLNGHHHTEAKWTLPRVEPLRLVSVLLVLGILLAMGWGISEVVRGLNIRLSWTMIGAGFVFGALLMKYARYFLTSVLFSLFTGMLFSAMMIGRLWDDLWRFLSNMVFWGVTQAGSIVRTMRGDPTLPSFESLFLYIYDLTESLYTMLQRFVLWVWRFPRVNPDLIATLLVWALLMWLIAVWAAWFLWMRKRPMEAVIPAFLLVAIAHAYANASPNVLLAMLGAVVLLMVLSSQADREREWKARGLGYSDLIRKNSTQAALALSMALVFTAGGITSVDVDKLREAWEDFTTRQERYSNSNSGEIQGNLGIVQDENRATLAENFSRFGRGGLPTSHLVGSSPELADEIVMVVRVEETDPLTGEVLDVDPVTQTYYFRSFTYDEYSLKGWNSNNGKVYVYQGGQEAIATYTNHQRLIQQQVRYEGPAGGMQKVHVVGEVAVVDRMYNVSWREGRGLSAFMDMFGATVESRSYEAYSVIPVFSEEELRNATMEFPDWMVTRYLELPDTVPDRVLELAYDLTRNELNNYDKAVAIEQYLRRFPYTLDLPDKPLNTDIADYFLFELQEGYCDYYASSMVVLARAAGIPARLVIGYIGGTYDPENDYYVVTADQAHSWVEVYFPEYGWVTFEPTGGRAAVERETQQFDLPNFEQEITFTQETTQLSGLEKTLRALLGLVLLVIVGGVVWLQVDVFWLRRMPIGKTFGVLYRRLLWFSKRLGVERGAAQTPQEFSATLQNQLIRMADETRVLKYLSKSAQQVDALVRLTNKAAYSHELPDVFERAQAVYLWVRLRRGLGVAIVLQKLFSWLTLGRKKTTELTVT